MAGLGNPGAEYANTPHSIGFAAVDMVVAAFGGAWQRKSAFQCEIAQGVLAGCKITAVKPMTYMNLSGNAVAPVVKYANARPEDLIVISDDIDLPLGRIRIRMGGSAGGHNGLKSVISSLGSQDFLRVRIGVGREGRDREEVISHVLGKFDAHSREVALAAARKAAEAVEFLISNPIQTAMNRFNGFNAAETGNQGQQQ